MNGPRLGVVVGTVAAVLVLREPSTTSKSSSGWVSIPRWVSASTAPGSSSGVPASRTEGLTRPPPPGSSPASGVSRGWIHRMRVARATAHWPTAPLDRPVSSVTLDSRTPVGVVRIDERWPTQQRLSFWQQLGHRVDRRHLERLRELQVGQQTGQSLSQHRLARTRWPGQVHMVPASRRDLDRQPSLGLTENVAEIEVLPGTAADTCGAAPPTQRAGGSSSAQRTFRSESRYLWTNPRSATLWTTPRRNRRAPITTKIDWSRIAGPA